MRHRTPGIVLLLQVCMLRALSPSATRYEMRCLLAALAGTDEAGTGKVTLPQLRQVVAAFSFAQAYPVRLVSCMHAASCSSCSVTAGSGRLLALFSCGAKALAGPSLCAFPHSPQSNCSHLQTEDEERQQQAAAAARAAKAAAVLADVGERRPPGTPLTAAGCQSDFARRRQAARRPETAPRQRGHASSGGVQQPLAVVGVAASAQPQQASAAHAVPGPLSDPSQTVGPAATVGQPVSIPLSTAAAGAAGGVVVGWPVGSGSWQQICQEAPGVGSGAAGPPAMWLQQGHVIGWPLPPVASYPQPQLPPPAATRDVSSEQPWAAQHQLPQQPALAAQPAGADPLQALISRAEQLQQAMSRAAFNPSQALLRLAPSSSGGCSSSHQARGAMVNLCDNSLLPIGAAPPLHVQPAVQPALESVAMGSSSRPATSAAARLPAGLLGGAAAGGADPAGSLSAASAALIEAARALSKRGQASAAAVGASAPVATGRAVAGSIPPDTLVTAHTGVGGSVGAVGSPGTGDGVIQQAPPTAAADTCSEVSWDDPAELAEDIILQELFFSLPAQRVATAQQPAGSPGLRAALRPHSPTQPEGAARAASAEQHQQDEQGSRAQAQEPVAEYVLSLRLGALRLRRQEQQQRRPATSHTKPAGGAAAATMPQPLVSRAVRVRGVVKQLHPSAQPVQFVLAAGGPASGKGATAARFEGPHASTVQLEVPVPTACVEQGQLPSTLFIEVGMSTAGTVHHSCWLKELSALPRSASCKAGGECTAPCLSQLTGMSPVQPLSRRLYVGVGPGRQGGGHCTGSPLPVPPAGRRWAAGRPGRAERQPASGGV